MNLLSLPSSALLALLTSGALAQTPPSPVPSKDFAIVGARIEVGDGTVVPVGTVVVHDGKILAAGPEVVLPEGIETLDGKGLVVYPGFIDAYVTRGVKVPDAPPAGTPPDTRANAPASMWHGNRKGIRSDILVAKNLDVKSRAEDQRAQGITTALVTPGEGTIRGVAAVVDYVGDGTVLVPAAAVEMAFRPGSGTGTATGYPGTLFGLTSLMRQTLADAQTYAPPSSAPKDVALENLKPLVQGQIPALFAVDSAREILRAERVADEFGLRMMVAGGNEAYRDLDEVKARRIPVLLSLDLPDAPKRTSEPGPNAVPQPILEERYLQWQERQGNAKALSDAGVPIAFYAGGGFGNYLGGVRKMLGAGLPRDAALRAMTLGAATILGVADRVGTVQPGKLANLTIMTGDFADPKSEIRTVTVEGQRFEVKKK